MKNDNYSSHLNHHFLDFLLAPALHKKLSTHDPQPITIIYLTSPQLNARLPRY
jgi:hypothetical protein